VFVALCSIYNDSPGGMTLLDKPVFKIGMLGLGTVGSEVARRLEEKADFITKRTGAKLELKRVLVRNPAKPRAYSCQPGVITTDPYSVVDDPDIDIVIEVMGGYEPARSLIERAIMHKKHVVTANKLVMARSGYELLRLAEQNNVDIYLEAAVGGGIPLISTFRIDLLANEIQSITAVINGTTNYILSRMVNNDLTMDQALKEAQEQGYAEADPSSDIDGHDAVYKLAIMSSIAFGIKVQPDQIFREGIRHVEKEDLKYARDLGHEIKLVAMAKKRNNSVEMRVHPALIPLDNPLAQVQGIHNAVFIQGDLVGEVWLSGPGAGGRPTASAVVGDVIDLVHSLKKNVVNRIPVEFDDALSLMPHSEITTKSYFRIIADDAPGVLASIAKVFAQEHISIASMIQRSSNAHDQSAELLFMMHPAKEHNLQRGLEMLKHLECVRKVCSFYRVL
jgi:homoserine dehydrogenase